MFPVFPCRGRCPIHSLTDENESIMFLRRHIRTLLYARRALYLQYEEICTSTDLIIICKTCSYIFICTFNKHGMLMLMRLSAGDHNKKLYIWTFSVLWHYFRKIYFHPICLKISFLKAFLHVPKDINNTDIKSDLNDHTIKYNVINATHVPQLQTSPALTSPSGLGPHITL